MTSESVMGARSAQPQPTPSKCKIGNSIASTMNVIGMQKLRNRKGRFMYLNPQGE